MEFAALYHRPKLNFAAALDPASVEIRLQAKAGDLTAVHVLAGDKYAWSETKQLVPMAKAWTDGVSDYWQAVVTPPFRRLQYAFRVADGEDIAWFTSSGISVGEPGVDEPGRLFEYPFLNPADIFSPPAWVADAVFYQIFPERFANGDPANDPANVEAWGGKPKPDNFFGGDLQGVIDRLDHLEQLGVDAIYFTPIFEAPSNHKYDTRDYMKVDPHFGTNDTLRELIDACHARGIRVMLDAVFNHAGGTFPPFLDVLEKGRASRYADWFHIHEFPPVVKDGLPTYDTFAFVPQMPKWNTEHPEVRAYLLDIVAHWTNMGIDGWRLDVANEVDHQFWRDFRALVKSINPDVYILGEIWHDAIMWLQGDQFDAVMNYPFTTAVLDYAVHGRLDARGFANRLSRLTASLPTRVHHAAFNLLDSHDTPRLLTLCGGNKDKMRLATALLFTFTGTPCIYYGDEIGLEGGNDPDCRRCMEWDPAKQDADLFDHYRSLVALRRRHPVLRTGGFRVRHAEPDGTIFAFERFDAAERMIIALNNSDRSATFRLDGEGKRWQDVLTGETVVAKAACGQGVVDLPPYGYLILTAGDD